MFLLAPPDNKAIERFLVECETDTFSYPEIGSTRDTPPSSYNIDHNRMRLGTGQATFDNAQSAVRNWKMFGMEWVKLIHDNTPIEIGRTVAILVKHFGFYSLNAARIVYVLDETGEVRRFGFAYGTLSEHGEVGEERFSVEFHEATGEVWYELYAFSRPGSMLARIGYPLSRYLQKAFARDSKIAMLNAVSDRSESAPKP